MSDRIAVNREWTVTIECPSCGRVQPATVQATSAWNVYQHTCEGCEYEIMESEWIEVKGDEETRA